MRPNSDPDAARWMTLLEALEHIESVEKCDRVAAQVHLKHGIGHGVIPVKWADSEGSNDKPNVTELQRSQLVLSGPGLAPSDLSLRPMLVFRPAVHTEWSRTTSEAARSSEANQNATNVSTQWKVEERDGQWMSLVEAAEHIQMSQHCDSVEALRQLKREIGDGMVRVQWEDSKEQKDCPDPEYLQRSQLLLIGTGLAPDNVQYRSLLIERSAAQKLWPLSSNPTKGSAPTGSTSTTQPKKSPRQKVDDDRILSAARDIYRERENDPPNMDEAEKLIRKRLGGGKRDDIRKILKQEEFARLRRAPGNQPQG